MKTNRLVSAVKIPLNKRRSQVAHVDIFYDHRSPSNTLIAKAFKF